MIHAISLNICASPESNDHQVRIFVDGEDWLGSSSLGLDPREFFSQSTLLSDGSLIVGRCDCGVIGCCDRIVESLHDESIVTWADANGLNLAFDRKWFDAEILRASADLTWEDTNRAVERLVGDELRGLEIDGFPFQWASARIRRDVLTLSFALKDLQKLFEIPWDNNTLEDAVHSAREFRETRTNKAMDRSRGSAII